MVNFATRALAPVVFAVLSSPVLAFDDQRVVTLSGSEIGEVRTPESMIEAPAMIEIDVLENGAYLQTLYIESDTAVETCAETLRAAVGTDAVVTMTVDMAAMTMNAVLLESCVVD